MAARRSSGPDPKWQAANQALMKYMMMMAQRQAAQRTEGGPPAAVSDTPMPEMPTNMPMMDPTASSDPMTLWADFQRQLAALNSGD